jgi:mannose-1-phosphate guanylyltransferase
VKNTWVVVLAGGEGSRLRSLTTSASGVTVPKQFCSLQGGPSLLQKAVQRALAIAPMRHICAVVAAQHRLWREAQLQHLLADNVIEQPQNRGTAHGVLLPLLHIAARDPDANIMLLPADHYVRDEAVFANALRRAAACAASDRNGVYLLGIEPNEPDTELGYIVPEQSVRYQPSRVIEFIEKPTVDKARLLLARGALWNTFIVASSASALLGLYAQRFLSTILRMRHAVDHQGSMSDASILDDLYQQLPSRDFSREVLEGQETRLQVLPVPPCGWTDLGSPQRVAQTLQGLPHSVGATGLISHAALGLDLAAQHWQLEFARKRVSDAV